MISPKGIAAISLTLALSGCAAPRTVTKLELENMKREGANYGRNRWWHTGRAKWYYTGSKDGHHYFHQDDVSPGPLNVRIPENELHWPDTFPHTVQQRYWRALD